MTFVYLGLTVLQCFSEWHLGEDALFKKWFNIKNGEYLQIIDTKDYEMWVELAHLLYTCFTFYRAMYIFQGSAISILNTYIIPDNQFDTNNEYRGTLLFLQYIFMDNKLTLWVINYAIGIL